MNILVINYEYPPIGGGGGFVTRDILESMASMGHDVSVLTSHYDNLEYEEVINGVRIIRVPVFFRRKVEVANIPSMLSYFPMAFLNGYVRFAKVSFDIVNTHFAIPSGPVGQLLAKKLRVPNVLSIHGGDIYDPSKLSSPHRVPFLFHTVRAMLKSADRLVAQSNDTKQNAVRYYDIKRHIDLIPLGIKKPVFEKKKREDFDLSEDDFVFCTIGRLVKRKNTEEALTVLSNVKGQSRVKFLIIGDGPERRKLEIAIRKLNLSDSVCMMGNVSDEVKFQLLDLSDCYLSTALHEGFGLVFLEAMACGLPIICFNNGGQTDFLVNGRNGFLTEVGDLVKFTECINTLLSDLKVRDQMGETNRHFIKEFYIERCAKQYIELFHQVLNVKFSKEAQVRLRLNEIDASQQR
jgi:glycosyltransferase involved in cell wall biosynthesis